MRAELLHKDEPAGVYSIQRHCLESYLAEPAVLAAAFGLGDAEKKILTLGESRFWADLASAVLDALGYALRQERLHLGSEALASKAEVMEAVKSNFHVFHGKLNDTAVENEELIEQLIEEFERDMRSAPLWMRVNGKKLLKALAKQLGDSALPGGDIEASLFGWCKKNGPPAPLAAEVQRVLDALPK